MARILVFDSGAEFDSAGDVLDQRFKGFSVDVGEPKLTQPFRLFSVDGEERVLGIEILADFEAESTLNFGMLYHNDVPGLVRPPSPLLLADDIRLPNTYQSESGDLDWMAEVTEEVGDAGAVTHNFVTRSIAIGGDKFKRRAYLPIAIHGVWGCMRLWFTDDPPADSEGVTARLYVFAHIGGHDEDAFTEGNSNNDDQMRPYAYNAQEG